MSKYNFVLHVEFERDGQREEVSIQKSFDLNFRPMIDDEVTICGDCPFVVTEFCFDADSGEAEVHFDRGPCVDNLQRWLDEGFSLYYSEGTLPDGIVWPGS